MIIDVLIQQIFTSKAFVTNLWKTVSAELGLQWCAYPVDHQFESCCHQWTIGSLIIMKMSWELESRTIYNPRMLHQFIRVWSVKENLNAVKSLITTYDLLTVWALDTRVNIVEWHLAPWNIPGDTCFITMKVADQTLKYPYFIFQINNSKKMISNWIELYWSALAQPQPRLSLWGRLR